MSFEGFGLFGKRSLSLTHPPAILRVVWEVFGRTEVRRLKRLLSDLVRVRVGFVEEVFDDDDDDDDDDDEDDDEDDDDVNSCLELPLIREQAGLTYCELECDLIKDVVILERQ